MLEDLKREGYAILPDLLSVAERRALLESLSPHEDSRPLGRNNFEGQHSKRVYSLAAKGAEFMRLAEHPRVLEVVDALLLPNALLSTMQSIRLLPGETEQPWHVDDAFYPLPRPHATLAVSVIWALEDFTTENGATEIIPKSHLWGDAHPDDCAHDVVKAIMKAGSAIVFDGALWHRGGANRSTGTRLAISPQYCQPWLRPQESQLLIAPPNLAANYSPRVRSMLGYSIHPPFIGQVDGMHPLRLLDAEYRAHKTEAAVIAERVLERPVSTTG